VRAILFSFCLLAGCKSGTALISSAANDIRDLSVSSEERFVQHGDEEGVREQQKIQEITGEVQTNLTTVQDSVPSWLSSVQTIAFVIGGIVVMALLWQSGLGMLMRRLVGWFPRKTQRQADMIHNVLESGKTENLRELIAQMRSQDTLLDEALRRKK
jgi:predicted PurR-regulated permease PerM